MATTTGSTKRMVHAGGIGGTHSAVAEVGLAQDSAIAAGDLLIINSQRLDEAADDPAADTIVGVALEATAAQDEVFGYAMALPGQVFEANIINGTSDQTAAVAEDINVLESLKVSADGFWCVDQGGSNNSVRTFQYAKQHGPSQQHLGPLTVPTETYAVGSTINPRVKFMFVASHWTMESI